MNRIDENENIAPEGNGPALLPPPVKPAKSVLRAIEALDAAEARGSGENRKSEAPVIEAVAFEEKKSAGPKPAPQGQAPRGDEATRERAKAEPPNPEPIMPLRASAFRPNGQPPAPKPARSNGWLLRAAGIAVLLGAGWAAAAQMSSLRFDFFSTSAPTVAQVSPIDQLRADLQQVAGELTAMRTQLTKLDAPEQRARQTAELEALKRSLADLSRRIEQGRTAQTSAVTEIGARLERARTEDARQREEIAERIARIERQVSDGRPTATQAAIQQPISQQPSTQLPNSTVVPRVVVTPPPAGIDPNAARKPQGLAGYVVREVYNGMALIEGRNGYLEVFPGAFVPGAGRVQQIVRRSGQWVVVTSNGVIGPQVE